MPDPIGKVWRLDGAEISSARVAGQALCLRYSAQDRIRHDSSSGDLETIEGGRVVWPRGSARREKEDRIAIKPRMGRRDSASQAVMGNGCEVPAFGLGQRVVRCDHSDRRVVWARSLGLGSSQDFRRGVSQAAAVGAAGAGDDPTGRRIHHITTAVHGHQGSDGRSVIEVEAGTAHTSLHGETTAEHLPHRRPCTGADTSLHNRRGARCFACRKAVFSVGVACRIANSKVVEDGRGNNGHGSMRGLVADVSLSQELHDTISGSEAKSTSPGQDDRVYDTHGCLRAKQIGFTSSRGTAAHGHAGYGAGHRENHGTAGWAIIAPSVTDEHAIQRRQSDSFRHLFLPGCLNAGILPFHGHLPSPLLPPPPQGRTVGRQHSPCGDRREDSSDEVSSRIRAHSGSRIAKGGRGEPPMPCSLRGFRNGATFLNVRNDVLRWTIGLACLAVLTYAAYLIFAPFLRAIAWALILTIMLAPVQSRLARWIRWPSARAAVTCLLAMVLLVGPLAGLTTVLVRELIDGLQYVQAHAGDIGNVDPSNWRPVAAVSGWLQSWFGEPRYQDLLQTQDLGSRVVSAAQGLSQWLLAQSSAIVGNVARFSFTAVVTWLCLFYFLRDGDRGLRAATELLPYPDDLKHEMLERLNGVVVSSVYGGLIVALVQGTLGAIAFAVIGIPSPVLWGTVMAVLSFLPVVGASLVWAPAAVVLAIQGRVGAAIGLAIWGALAVGLVDNFLRPMLISGRTQMHPLLTFLAVLGGIQAFGLLGLFLGPVLVALVTGVLDVYRATVRGELGSTRVAAPPSGGAVEEAEAAAG